MTKLRELIRTFDDEFAGEGDSVTLENFLNDLRDIAGELEELEAVPDLATLATVVKAVDDRLQNIETMVELVAKHVEPVIAEVTASPMFRMLTGGKK